MASESFTKKQVNVILGQWFHPLHYFPGFVSRLIGISPSLAVRTLMSKIVWQELGEGNPERAHETCFVETMMDAGFIYDKFVNVEPLHGTSKLVSEYEEKSANDSLSSLGYVFATEAADLLMVSSIGSAVKSATGKEKLLWVDIHVKQEPDHTECVESSVIQGLSADDGAKVIEAADKMFDIWCGFFTDIEMAVDNINENSEYEALSA